MAKVKAVIGGKEAKFTASNRSVEFNEGIALNKYIELSFNDKKIKYYPESCESFDNIYKIITSNENKTFTISINSSFVGVGACDACNKIGVIDSLSSSLNIDPYSLTLKFEYYENRYKSIYVCKECLECNHLEINVVNR